MTVQGDAVQFGRIRGQDGSFDIILPKILPPEALVRQPQVPHD